MHRHAARLAATAALALGLIACGQPAHDNPFDPSTPPALQARATLAGTVTLESVDGSLPATSGVHVSIPGTSLSADTDAAGAYAIAGVAPGTWSVQATRPGYRDALVTGVAVTLDDGNRTLTVPPLDLRVARGDVLGRVALQLDVATGALEQSAAGVGVSLSGRPGAVFTDAAGDYAIGGVPVGVYALTAGKPGFKDGTITLVEVTEGRSTVLAELVLPPDPGGIGGAVAVPGSADAFGVTVRARGTTLSGTPTEVTTTSAADGSWLISPIPAGTYTVTFEKPAYVVASAAATVAPATITDLAAVTLRQQTGAVAGTFLLAGASASAGVVVTLQGTSLSTVTDASGAFALSGVPVGTYTVVAARPPEWQGASVGGVVVTRDATAALPGSPVALAPVATAGLSGTARLERQADASGTTVTLTGADFRGVAVVRSTGTAADGSYQLAGLAQGTYALAFSHPSYDARAATGLYVPAAAQVTAPDVTLPVARGVVAGTVALGAGAVAGFQIGSDLSGVVVTLAGTDVPVPSAVTDAAGAYRFVDVPVSLAGAAFTVTATRSFFAAASTSVLAVADATVAVPLLSLPLAAGTLSGTTLLRDDVGGAGDNATHAGVSVGVSGTAFNGVGWSTAAGSAADGSWASGALPPGTYDVAPASAGRTCAAYPRTALAPAAAVALGTV
ncbi:MAG TPA: carboxypeptidase regulatory-like domain-containing protein, partial [Anaeromyxobacteraceae bacterium]|nr:carboxypeptidase regulatory-like domain-containing protein [Anaeromyxobacteraceae bacterium]